MPSPRTDGEEAASYYTDGARLLGVTPVGPCGVLAVEDCRTQEVYVVRVDEFQAMRLRRVRPRGPAPVINPRPKEVIDMATHDRTGIGATQRPRRRRGHFGVHDAAPTAEPTPPTPVGSAPAAAGRRPDRMFAATLEVIAGIWLVISPWVLGYTGDDASWNPIVFGAIVIVLALARAAAGDRAAWLSGVTALIGGWLFASAFWLADSAQASWNVGILGVVVFLLALWSMSTGVARRRDPAGV